MKPVLIAAALLASALFATALRNAAADAKGPAKSPAPAATGLLACSARVLAIQDTDIGLNDSALARLTLRVTPPRRRAFDTTIWKEVSMEAPPRRGSVLRLTCDPANPGEVHPID